MESTFLLVKFDDRYEHNVVVVFLNHYKRKDNQGDNNVLCKCNSNVNITECHCEQCNDCIVDVSKA